MRNELEIRNLYPFDATQSNVPLEQHAFPIQEHPNPDVDCDDFEWHLTRKMNIGKLARWFETLMNEREDEFPPWGDFPDLNVNKELEIRDLHPYEFLDSLYALPSWVLFSFPLQEDIANGRPALRMSLKELYDLVKERVEEREAANPPPEPE